MKLSYNSSKNNPWHSLQLTSAVGQAGYHALCLQVEGKEVDQEYFGVATPNNTFPFGVFPDWAQPAIKLHIL